MKVSDRESILRLTEEHMRTRGFSERTIKPQLYCLEYFLGFLEDRGVEDLAAVTQEVVEDYALALERHRFPDGRPYAFSTREHRMQAVRTLFRVLEERGLILIDPSARIPRPRPPRTLPRGIMTAQQMLRLLQVPDTKTPLGLRDRAILELLYSAGLRRRELVQLDLEDVDFSARLVQVRHGKGGKERTAPFGRTAVLWLQRYLARTRPQLEIAGPSEALFLSWRGKRIGPELVSKLVRQCADEIGLPRTVTAHSIRHTCATEMLRGGASVRHLQELLGHTCLESTQIYTHVLPLDLQQAQRKARPREGKAAQGGRVRFEPHLGPYGEWLVDTGKRDWQRGKRCSRMNKKGRRANQEKP